MADPNKMKTLTIGSSTYEVCDEVARTSIGVLNELNTVNKSNLVDAINEVYVKVSGGIVDKLVLKSPDGTAWNITVSNSGVITATKVE